MRDGTPKLARSTNGTPQEATEVLSTQGSYGALPSAMLNVEAKIPFRRCREVDFQLNRMKKLAHSARIAGEPLLKALVVPIAYTNVKLGEVHGAPSKEGIRVRTLLLMKPQQDRSITILRPGVAR